MSPNARTGLRLLASRLFVPMLLGPCVLSSATAWANTPATTAAQGSTEATLA